MKRSKAQEKICRNFQKIGKNFCRNFSDRKFSVESELSSGGYPTEWFVNPVLVKHMECPICYKVLFEPTQMDECGHVFCKTCLKDADLCPMCRKSGLPTFNRFAKTMVGQQEMFCPHAVVWEMKECEWKGKVEDLMEHLQKCPLRKVTCNFCFKRFHAFEKEHECPQQLVECECGEMVVRERQDAHLNSCVAVQRHCVFCKESHSMIAECAEKPKTCLCGWRGQTKAFQAHWRETEHLRYLEEAQAHAKAVSKRNEDLLRHLSILMGTLHMSSLMKQVIRSNMISALDTCKFVGANFDRPLFMHTGGFPLHAACTLGHVKIVEWLLKENVRKDVKNNDGLTPIEVACENGHGNVVELMIKHNAYVSPKVHEYLAKNQSVQEKVEEFL